jgi:hypothetical protein
MKTNKPVWFFLVGWLLWGQVCVEAQQMDQGSLIEGARLAWNPTQTAVHAITYRQLPSTGKSGQALRGRHSGWVCTRNFLSPMSTREWE